MYECTCRSLYRDDNSVAVLWQINATFVGKHTGFKSCQFTATTFRLSPYIEIGSQAVADTRSMVVLTSLSVVSFLGFRILFDAPLRSAKPFGDNRNEMSLQQNGSLHLPLAIYLLRGLYERLLFRSSRRLYSNGQEVGSRVTLGNEIGEEGCYICPGDVRWVLRGW